MAAAPDDPGLEIDVADLEPALEAGEVTLIDVREPHEWEAGRIPGALHVPLGELGARFQELPTGRPVVFQCLSGGRSLRAAQAFQAAGYPAVSLRGGIRAWVEAGHPLDPEDGTVAEH